MRCRIRKWKPSEPRIGANVLHSMGMAGEAQASLRLRLSQRAHSLPGKPRPELYVPGGNAGLIERISLPTHIQANCAPRNSEHVASGRDPADEQCSLSPLQHVRFGQEAVPVDLYKINDCIGPSP